MFKDAMTRDRPRARRARASRTSLERGAGRCRRASASRPSSARRFTLGGTGGGIAYNPEEFETICKRGLDAVADAASC